MVSEQKLQGREGALQVGLTDGSSGGGNDKCKGPEAGCSQNV